MDLFFYSYAYAITDSDVAWEPQVLMAEYIPSGNG